MSKSFCFTINNYTEADVEAVKNVLCQRIVAGKEVGENGTPHIQGAVTFKRSYRRAAVGKLLGGRAHVEEMRGKWEDQEYCQKDGDVIRCEQKSSQGERVDLSKAVGLIQSKRRWADVVNDPELYKVMKSSARWCKEVFDNRPKVPRKAPEKWRSC